MARITKTQAIATLKKYITEVDQLSLRAQADAWFYRVADSLNLYIGDTILNRAFKEFSMSRIADDPESRYTVYNPDSISMEEYRLTQKAELKALLNSIAQYIGDNGLIQPDHTYDNPFTGMSFKAKCWFFGGLTTYTVVFGTILFNVGRAQPNAELEQYKIQNLHLRLKFDSVFRTNTFQNDRMMYWEEFEKKQMSQDSGRTEDSINKAEQ